MNKVLEIMDALNNIEYGFKDEDGNNLINNEIWDREFYNFYYLLSPEELLKSKCGVCWDQVELERNLFNDAKIDCETYFIYIDDNQNLPSHTFLTFQLDNKYYWFEHSWADMKGIHEYNDLEELLNDVKIKFIESRKNEINPNLNYNTYIYKYNKPKYHINCDEFYKYIKTQEKIEVSKINEKKSNKLLIIGILPFAIPIILSVKSIFNGANILFSHADGIDAALSVLITWSYLFWPTYIIGAILIIISLTKIKIRKYHQKKINKLNIILYR